MDAEPTPDRALSELERRLSACRPAADGLDADRMLFAAGRASARPGPGRLAWPVLALGMTLVTAGLGAWAASERVERVALAAQLRRQTPAPAPPRVTPRSPTSSEFAVEPVAPDSYLAARHLIEQGLDGWPAGPAASEPPGPPPRDPPVLRARPPGGMPEL
jgi:hypothetical protein